MLLLNQYCPYTYISISTFTQLTVEPHFKQQNKFNFEFQVITLYMRTIWAEDEVLVTVCSLYWILLIDAAADSVNFNLVCPPFLSGKWVSERHRGSGAKKEGDAERRACWESSGGCFSFPFLSQLYHMNVQMSPVWWTASNKLSEILGST